jgi:dTMP kinase
MIGRRGFFITLEGMDGCGKSTQARLLLPWLRKRLDSGKTVFSREPGGTPLGRRIRSILLDPRSESLAPMAELLLYCADRAQHMKKIEKNLNAGKLVLCDRFMDSTTVYQGWARTGKPGAPSMAFVESLHRAVVEDLAPDLTLVFDLPVEEAMRRARARNRASRSHGREGRFEARRREFHEKIRKGFLFLARWEKKRVRLVDASGSAAEVQQRVRNIVEPRLRGLP